MGNPIFLENSDYAVEFLRYLGEHPEEADRIPEGAVVVFMPEQLDPGLACSQQVSGALCRGLPRQGTCFRNRSDDVGD